MTLMNVSNSVLVLVDYQSRLMPAIHDANQVTKNAMLLATSARMLEIPVLGTEQNPAGLGHNIEAIKAICTHTLSKLHFNACEDGLLQAIEHPISLRNQVVIAGCEAHVCMMQTALGLLQAGKQVFVVGDASGSRRVSDHKAAMGRLRSAGAIVASSEMVIFEWLYHCKHAKFKDILGLVKAAS